LEIRDLTIIGALAATFRACRHDLSSRVADSPSPLGRVAADYSEKKIHDVSGVREVLGKELPRNPAKQAVEVQLGCPFA
jgi:thioredoxin reductase